MTKFAGDLLTPRQDIADNDSGIDRTPLLMSQRYRRIKSSWQLSDKLYGDRIETASDVGKMVRDTLWFRPITGRDRPFRPDTLTNEQATNCYGHTIVTSEVLDSLGVEHFIGFANTHSFVLIAGDTAEKVFMVDAAARDFYMSIGAAIGGDVRSQIEQGSGIANNILDTRVILADVDSSLTRQELMSKHPWLGFGDRNWVDDKKYMRAHRLFMRSYTSQLGRAVLENYMNAIIFNNNDQLESAVDAVRKLEGIYPEMDARNKLGVVTPLRNKLVRAGRIGEVEDMIRVVDSSLVEGDTSANQFFMSDSLRQLAERQRSLALAECALGCLAETRGGPLRDGKNRKTRELVGRLTG